MEIEMFDAFTVTALTVQDRAALAMNASKTEIDLKALAVKNVHIVAVIDKAGREQAHGAAMELKRARTSIEKASKDARDDATKFSKAVIQEEKRLVAIVEPEEVRLFNLRDGWDDEQARIRAESDRIERARITAIHERIANIRGYVSLAAQCRTAARIEELLGKLARTSLEGFEEFSEEAATVHADAMKRVEAALVEKHLEEQERARVKAEQDRIKAEQAEAATKLAVERTALDKEKAELASARAALEVQQAAIAPVVAVVATVEVIETTAPAEATNPAPADPVTTANGPTDDEVMWVAARAVADEFNMTQGQAAKRIAALFLPEFSTSPQL